MNIELFRSAALIAAATRDRQNAYTFDADIRLISTSFCGTGQAAPEVRETLSSNEAKR
jgi:hypothetical protein